MNNFLPGDIRFFREQILRLNKNLKRLNDELATLSEREAMEKIETEFEKTDKEFQELTANMAGAGAWQPHQGGSIFRVNSYLFMKTHQIKGERVEPSMNGKWAGFLEVIDREGNVLWEVTQTDDAYDTEELCKIEIEHLTNAFLDEWDANTNPIIGENRE